MLSADEREELRSLQARAYGRDAVLTSAEAARLRELDDLRVAAAVAAVAPPPLDDAAVRDDAPSGPTAPGDRAHDTAAGGVGAVGFGAPPEDDDIAPSVGDTADDADPGSGSAFASLRALVRRHWRPAVLAVAVVLVVGVGIGWLAFGRSDGTAPVELTAEQQAWQDDLISGGHYDSGSIRALAVEKSAVIWTATMDERARTCLILGSAGVTLPTCAKTETAVEAGIYGSMTLRGEGELQRQLTVQMLFTVAGEPAVAVSSYDYDPGVSGITYANERESQIAERLVAAGFDANSLWVVGYDGDVPIWTGVSIDAQTQCLIYDGSEADAPSICADPETMQDQESSLVLNVVDTATGGTTHLELPSTQGPGYLVITHEGGVEGAGED